MPRAKKQNAMMNESEVMQPQYQNNQNNVLYIILAILVVFSAYMFVRMLSLEKKLAAGGAAGAAQQDSPLSTDKLKKYAKELGLNTGKFNKCLDNGEKKAEVTAQESYGASLGVQGTPGFFINGKFLAGAFPFQFFKEIIDKELAGTGSVNCTDYSTDLQAYCSDPKNLSFDPAPKQVDFKGAELRGTANAPVKILEFSDFECPFCIRAFPTVEQILSTYKGKVAFYYKQFPLTQIHPHAEAAAEASLCAADQGKFWEWHDKIFKLEQTN